VVAEVPRIHFSAARSDVELRKVKEMRGFRSGGAIAGAPMRIHRGPRPLRERTCV
jgi:hypothetical protein